MRLTYHTIFLQVTQWRETLFCCGKRRLAGNVLSASPILYATMKGVCSMAVELLELLPD